MMLREHADAGAFVEALRPMWAPREAELNLLVGVACTLRDGWRPERGVVMATLERGATHAVTTSLSAGVGMPSRSGATHVIKERSEATVGRHLRGAVTTSLSAGVGMPSRSGATHVVAAVLRTPPHGFVVAEGAPGAAAQLARALARSAEHLDAAGVIATSPAAEQFAHAWADATGRSPSLTTPQRIYALEAVIPPPPPAGRFRRAEARDAAIIAPWFHDFALEAMPHEAGEREATIAMARARIERGVVSVWETDGAPSSMAMLARPTPHGVTITGVYTPPALRGRGYASACVAALSQSALDSGKRFACLYTDARNPTSNAIYERIGYRKVCDSAQWSFG